MSQYPGPEKVANSPAGQGVGFELQNPQSLGYYGHVAGPAQPTPSQGPPQQPQYFVPPPQQQQQSPKQFYPQQAPPTYMIPTTFARKIADVPKAQHGFYENMQDCFGQIFGTFGAYIPCCCCCSNPFKIVPQGYAGLVSRFGKCYRVVDPGLYFINTNTESLQIVPTSVTITDIPRQIVMTRDNVSVNIDSVIYWHVVDPFVAKFHVGNIEKALMERTMTTLKDTLGAHDLQNVIGNREALAQEIKGIIDRPAAQWGVQVESLLVKDLQFSPELQESLASAAKQKRQAEGKVIAARGEVDAARLMREAATILNTPAAMQFRYLETLSSMSKQANTKVIFMPVGGDSGATGFNPMKDIESKVVQDAILMPKTDSVRELFKQQKQIRRQIHDPDQCAKYNATGQLCCSLCAPNVAIKGGEVLWASHLASTGHKRKKLEKEAESRAIQERQKQQKQKELEEMARLEEEQQNAANQMQKELDEQVEEFSKSLIESDENKMSTVQEEESITELDVAALYDERQEYLKQEQVEYEQRLAQLVAKRTSIPVTNKPISPTAAVKSPTYSDDSSDEISEMDNWRFIV